MPGLPRLDSPLTDGHVALREWTDEDVQEMSLLLHDPDIVRWTRVPSPYTRADGDEFVRRMERARQAGIELALAIVSANGDAPLGSISVRVSSWEDLRGELGYLVYAPARGRGVATRAVRLLAHFAFERLGLLRMEIRAATGNDASQRVAEKAGFAREGVLRSYMVHRNGERLDMVAFSLLPDELRPSGR